MVPTTETGHEKKAARKKGSAEKNKNKSILKDIDLPHIDAVFKRVGFVISIGCSKLVGSPKPGLAALPTNSS